MDERELATYLESENPTVEEVIDRLEPGAAYELFNGGAIPPDFDDYHQEVWIAREEVAGDYAEEPGPELVIRDAEGLEYVWIPISFPLHDAPYILGKKTAEIGYAGEREATAEDGIGVSMVVGAAVSTLIDATGHVAADIDIIPDKAVYIGGAASLFGGNALRGRAAGIREKIHREELAAIEEQAGDYTVSIY